MWLCCAVLLSGPAGQSGLCLCRHALQRIPDGGSVPAGGQEAVLRGAQHLQWIHVHLHQDVPLQRGRAARHQVRTAFLSVAVADQFSQEGADQKCMHFHCTVTLRCPVKIRKSDVRCNASWLSQDRDTECVWIIHFFFFIICHKCQCITSAGIFMSIEKHYYSSVFTLTDVDLYKVLTNVK